MLGLDRIPNGFVRIQRLFNEDGCLGDRPGTGAIAVEYKTPGHGLNFSACVFPADNIGSSSVSIFVSRVCSQPGVTASSSIHIEKHR